MKRERSTSLQIIIDAHYPACEDDRARSTLATQIGTLHGLNHKYTTPCTLSVCGSEGLQSRLNVAYRTAGWKDFAFTTDAVVSSESMIYLTPDAETELTEVDPTATYVIAGLLDRGQEDTDAFTSYRKARGVLTVRTMRIPTVRHVQLRAGGALTLSSVFKILMDMLGGKDLGAALRTALAPRGVIAWRPSVCPHQWLEVLAPCPSVSEGNTRVILPTRCKACGGVAPIQYDAAMPFITDPNGHYVTVPASPSLPARWRDALTWDTFLRDLPKTELHSHLNGCIRKSTLCELMVQRGFPAPCLLEDISSDAVGPARIAETFELFAAIYKVVDNVDALRRVASEALEDYVAERCVYLELRTTPKAFAGSSREAYIDTVLEEIDKAKDRISVGLILSINRGNSIEDGMAVVALAKAYKGKGVVGVDLAGNWLKGKFSDFVPMLQAVRDAGISVTVHAGEKDDPSELGEIVDFGPDRYGHLMFVDEANRARILKSRAPLEVCFTSNLFTGQWTPGEHPFPTWFFKGHPVSLNTDDRGVMTTSLTQEYRMVQRAYNLTQKHMRGLALAALEQSFAPLELKRKLRPLWVLE